MNDKEETDSDGAPDYEDDFEKDLDWLINEEEKQNAAAQNENGSEQKPNNLTGLLNGDSPGDIIDSDTDQDVPNMNAKLLLDTVPESEEFDPEDEEAKRYIAEKIEEANKKLEMETIDENRQRKLKFKDTLVDLEVPPPDFPDSDRTESITEDDVVDSITKLNIQEGISDTKSESAEAVKDRKVLVEKDGKFELVNLQDIQNQCSLPPINSNNDLSNVSGFSATANGDDFHDKNISAANNIHFLPQPPKVRPSSATHSLKSLHKVKPARRAQSATVSSRNTTFSLSPEQKELQKRIHERKERLKREEEEFKKEEEERKQRENDLAFKVWLQKKNQQLLLEKRMQQAKKLERTDSAEKEKDSHEAYDLWLKRKHKEQMIEKKIEELRKQETASFLEERKDSDRAFVQWLKQKRIQKRAEQQAAKERSRRLLLEARKRKQIHDLLYSISDSKSFRYTDPYS